MNGKIFNICKLVIVVIFCVFFIPLIINLLFKIQSPMDLLVSEWTAGDALNFYGTIIGVIIAVYGVDLSIKSAQQNYKEDVRQRVLPYISLSKLHAKSHINLINMLGQNSCKSKECDTDIGNVEYYKEYKLNKIYFIISEGKISVLDDLTEEQKEILKRGGIKSVNSPGKYALVDVNLVSMPLEINNVGNGAAINLRIGLNPIDEEHMYLRPLVLKTDDTMYIHIYCENQNELSIGDYDFEFFYEDIYKTKYKQGYIVSVKKQESKINGELDLGSSQKQI